MVTTWSVIIKEVIALFGAADAAEVVHDVVFLFREEFRLDQFRQSRRQGDALREVLVGNRDLIYLARTDFDQDGTHSGRDLFIDDFP